MKVSELKKELKAYRAKRRSKDLEDAIATLEAEKVFLVKRYKASMELIDQELKRLHKLDAKQTKGE